MKPKAGDEYEKKDVNFNYGGGVSAAQGGHFAQLDPSESPTYENCKGKSNYKKGFSMAEAQDSNVCVYLSNGAVGTLHIGDSTDGAYTLTVSVWTDPRPVVNRG